VDYWRDKTIKLNDSWGPGAANVLRGPLGSAPEFSLRARYLRGTQAARQLAQFRVEISSGYLSDGWQDAVFTPFGTVPVTGIAGLPPWDSSKADVYHDLIIGPNHNLGDYKTERLEGVIPFLDASGAVGYDTVRLFYASKAVQGGPNEDLVILKIATYAAAPGTVQVRQDGGGHGPPD
jgi:hypothetical protein